jgi:hypothetical protein
MTITRWSLVLFCGVALWGQPNNEHCVLDTAKDGDMVRIRGEVFPTGHDTFIRPTTCTEGSKNRVILIWASDSIGSKRALVSKDQAFEEFNRLIRSTLPLPPNSVGTSELRYRVTADFEGHLQVTSSAGWKRDPQTQKIIGVEGFGHPMPFTRFRLVATKVSQVEFKERRP